MKTDLSRSDYRHPSTIFRKILNRTDSRLVSAPCDAVSFRNPLRWQAGSIGYTGVTLDTDLDRTAPPASLGRMQDKRYQIAQ